MLAGGAGERLGGGKATVELAGRGLIEYPLAALAEAGIEAVVVAKLETQLPSLEVPVLREPEEPRHPLRGIVTALRAGAGRPVLVVACDLPLLTPPLLAALAAAPQSLAPAAAPESPATPEPAAAPEPLAAPEPAAAPESPATPPEPLAPAATPEPPATREPPAAAPESQPLAAAPEPPTAPERLVLAAPGGDPQPLLGRYAPELLPELEAALAREEPLRRTVAALSPRLFADAELARFGDPAELLLNVNDRADLARAGAILARR